jgi:hypothetical protein
LATRWLAFDGDGVDGVGSGVGDDDQGRGVLFGERERLARGEDGGDGRPSCSRCSGVGSGASKKRIFLTAFLPAVVFLRLTDFSMGCGRGSRARIWSSSGVSECGSEAAATHPPAHPNVSLDLHRLLTLSIAIFGLYARE